MISFVFWFCIRNGCIGFSSWWFSW
jgi:hypothetical protein